MRLYLLLIVCLSLPSLLPAQLNLKLLGHLPYPGATLAGCTHYVDSLGNEWALVGTSKGMSIVDLQDPTQPTERFFIPGITDNWRELRTWAGFAYVGSEAVGSGITIVDLRSLPDTIYWKNWTGDSLHPNSVLTSHTVQTSNGYLYIFGGTLLTNGAVIADLSDPQNPLIVGEYKNAYCHDGHIRGDTLWTSEIFDGRFGVVDISDKTSPKLLQTNPTPAKFNHNTELSPDGRILFTTDELPYAPLGAYDVSDLNNITLLDTYKPSRIPSGEVHNVRVFGSFLVNPSYRGQLTIVDATYPDNLVETAWYVLGNGLVWDADPYLPSGILFATAKAEGLFVFQPVYQKAAYLEGILTDSLTGLPLGGGRIVVTEMQDTTISASNGVFKTGGNHTGLFTLQAYRPGYESKQLKINLTTGKIAQITLALKPDNSVAAEEAQEFPGTVFPSPITDYIYIQLNTSIQLPARLRLYDASGKIHFEQEIENNRIQLNGLSTLAPGICFLQLTTGRKTWFRRIIKRSV